MENFKKDVMSTEISEILKKVRRLEIVSNRFANDLFAGQYKSVFRGRGMEFSEVREYQPGDDVRQIDWNVTARAGRPYIKRFVEERELTVLFLVDVSASGVFGSVRSKLDTAIEVAATLMFSALKNNDKVGLLTFCDDVIDYHAPQKGKGNVLRLIRELVGCRPVARPTDLEKAIQYANRVLKRRAVLFLISDFFAPEVKRDLAICRRKHDLIALSIADPREREFPNVGLLTLRDPETGEETLVDTANRRVREILADRLRVQRETVAENLRRAKVDRLDIGTDRDFLNNLRTFFKTRERRR